MAESGQSYAEVKRANKRAMQERMEKMKSEQERQEKENYRRKKLREGHERKQVGLEQFRAVF